MICVFVGHGIAACHDVIVVDDHGVVVAGVT